MAKHGPPTKCPNCNWFDLRYSETVCGRCRDSPVAKELEQLRAEIEKLHAEKKKMLEEREVFLASLAASQAEIASLKEQLQKASPPPIRDIGPEAERARLIDRAKGLEGNNE